MKYLIVGLGNIGPEYELTRHNVGFLTVDRLADKQGVSWKSDRLAFSTNFKYKSRQIYLIKPTTYMNLSGKAVNYWMKELDIPKENIMVIVDDVALPFGKLRMKGKGSDGGHNGLKDIQALLKTQEYARLRFGVGSDFTKGRQADYVLGEWKPEEKLALPERLQTAVAAAKSFVFDGLPMAMTNWNNK